MLTLYFNDFKSLTIPPFKLAVNIIIIIIMQTTSRVK